MVITDCIIKTARIKKQKNGTRDFPNRARNRPLNIESSLFARVGHEKGLIYPFESELDLAG
jgi:hypothetical protein